MVDRTQNIPSDVSGSGADLLQKIASFEIPTQAEYVDSLATMNVAIAVALCACGLIYLLHGWKAFKMLVIVNAALLGAFIGSQLGQALHGRNTEIFGAAAGAMLLAALAWPLMKVAVSLMGGLAGAMMGYGVWNYAAQAAGKVALAEHAWAGALIGLIGLGLLAFVIFRLVIMVFTSVQGAIMTVSGFVAILMRMETLRSDLYTNLRSNQHLLALAIAVPALIGFAFQYTALAKKAGKKKKAQEGDG